MNWKARELSLGKLYRPYKREDPPSMHLGEARRVYYLLS